MKVLSAFRALAMVVALVVALVGSILVVSQGAAFAQAINGVVLNEVVSDNDTSLVDEDGDSPDWIELANPTDSDVDIGGAYLSDDSGDLTQWQFPSGTTVPANGFLVVFASDKDRRNAGQPLHTNFKLSSGGEDVFLVATNGTTIVDELLVPALGEDRSYGRTASCETVSFEAEAGTTSGTFTTGADGQASNGAFVWAPNNGNEDYRDPSSIGEDLLGRVVFDFTSNNTGIFRIDTRVNGPDGGSDSFFVRVDSGPWWLYDIAAGGYVNDSVSNRNGADPVTFSLAPGSHRIEFAHREDGSRLDRFDLVATECFEGSSAPSLLLSPTPNAANSDQAPSTIALSPQSGVINGTQTVTLTSDNNGTEGTIRYTTNGSEPTPTSQAYTGPFTVSSSTILRARMFSGSASGDEANAVYTAVNGLPTSELPIVVVDTFAQAIPRSDVFAAVTVIDNPNGTANIFDAADFSGLADIKIRGSSSANFPKKQFKIELGEPTGGDVDADLLGLGEEEDWILYAPGRFDRSIVNNALGQALAGQVGLTELNYRFVEVYLNENGGAVSSGDYHGLYIMIESIKIEDTRVDITKPDPAGDITGGYIVSVDRTDTNEYNFATQQEPQRYFGGGDRVGVNVVRPKLDDLSGAQQAYIQGYIQDFETALYGPNFADPGSGYRAYIDVASFIDAHILRYLAKDPDIGRLSTFFNKDAGGLLRADPIWDLDRSYNSADRRSAEPAEPWFGDNGIDPLADGWWGRLFEDEQFRIEYTARWNQLRSSVLSDASVGSVIDDMTSEISSAYLREDARWGSTPNYGSRFGGLTGETENLKSWLSTRSAFMDETLTEWLLRDLAENGTPTQSSTDFDGVPTRAIDGDSNGRYQGHQRISGAQSVTHTAQEFQPWWQIDLGSVEDLGSIRLWNRSDCCPDRLTNVHVLVSDVPFASDSLSGAQAQAGVTDLFFAGAMSRTESIDVGRTGRFVRIQLEGTGILSLAEVDIIEDAEPPPPPEPIAPGLILNEWNAVSSLNVIAGGDSFFGSVPGNGGDWFELVVVEDNLDVRGWQLELADSDNGAPEITDTFVFGNNPLLADLRAGTIITVSEDLGDDVSFQPATGDWTINLQANSDDTGAFFTAGSQSNFDTNNADWQLRIIDVEGVERFGPAGEGVAGLSGVSSSEVGELELDPSDTVTPLAGYDDGDASTFGSPNESSGIAQNFSPLRAWFVPDTTAPVTVINAPAADEALPTGVVTLAGSSSDATGVARVDVTVQDTATSLYLQSNGTFGAAATALEAALAAPDATTTDWSLAIDVPVGSYEVSLAGTDVAGNPEPSTTSTFSVVDTPQGDVEPPSSPSGLTVVATTSASIEFDWQPSADNVGVVSYRVLRNGTAAGTTTPPSTTFVDTGLASNTSYTYEVVAIDAAGNTSAPGVLAVSTDTDVVRALSEIADPTWQTNGTVHAVLTVGETLYLAGDFTSVTDGAGSTVPRTNLAAIDRLTETVLPFAPVMDNQVFAMAASPDGSTLYVGGRFNNVNTTTRKRIAAFDIATGELTNFRAPVPNRQVQAIATDGTRLYIGGFFTKVGPTEFSRLAAIDLQTATIDATWAPSAAAGVNDLVVDGDQIWVAGFFNTINDQPAKGLAAVSVADGSVLPTEHPTFSVLDIDLLGNQLFVAGSKRAAAYSTDGLQQWSYWTNGVLRAVDTADGYVYFGGNHSRIRGTDVAGLTRHEIVDGALDIAWLPTINGARGVTALTVQGPRVYAGGDFTTVSGDAHQGLAIFSEAVPGPA